MQKITKKKAFGVEGNTETYLKAETNQVIFTLNNRRKRFNF